MKTIPRPFLFLALGLVFTAVSMPVQVMLAYGYMPWDLPQILSRLAPLNWGIAIFAFVEAAMALRASPMLWVVTPAYLALIGWNNWLVGEYGLNATPAELWSATFGAMLLHLPLMASNARQVLLNPRLRWWLTSPRRRIRMHAIVRPLVGQEVESSTFDISRGGAFIQSSSLHRGLEIGKRCSVKVRVDSDRLIQCQAEVVRIARGIGDYPSGFAIRFIGLNRSDLDFLARFASESRERGEEEGSSLAKVA